MFSQKKPYSAVTVTIENLTSESFQEDDLAGIPELVDAITLQASGPTEAARAIRKKLKYGNVHRQIRALVLLDGLILNAGPRFQRAFADEPLLERLRVCGSSDLSDPEVKKKCRELFQQWAHYANTPGLERVGRLHKELPMRKKAMTQERSKVVKETENPFGDDEEEEAIRAAEQRKQQQQQQQQQQQAGNAGPSNPKPLLQFGRSPEMIDSFSTIDSSKSKKKGKKDKGKASKFNLAAEQDQMKAVIAESSMASTNLVNALQSINRERERISDNQLAVQSFEACKKLRRRVLRYIHHVEHEKWLGGLLHANDELVHALMTYEQLDQSIDADSDSDDEWAEQAHLYRMVASRQDEEAGKAPDLQVDTPPPQPPRPPVAQLESDSEEQESEEDENDPFADRNMVHTPAVEKGEPRW